MKNGKNVDLTTGPIWKRLLVYFLPILAGSLFQQLYTTVDAVILGQFAGKTGLAAIDSVYSLLKLPVNFFIGLSTGATIMISQRFGAKDDEALSRAVHTGMGFALVGGLLLSVAGVTVAPLCLDAMRVPDEIRELALSYVRIYFGGLFLSLLFNIGSGIIRAVGDSRTPFHVLIVAGAANIALDLIFVAWLKLNAAGAALATVVSQGLSAALILRALARAKAAYRLDLKQLSFDGSILKNIFRLGLPIGFQSALFPIANMMVQSAINRTGTDNIAAWALCGKLDFAIWLIADSLAAAISTFVAQNYGSNNHSRCRSGVRVGLGMTLGAVALISAVLYWWSEPLGRLFINAGDGNIAELAAQIMRFIAPAYFLYVFGEVLSGAIRGTGESFTPMLITLLTTCAPRILWITLAVPQSEDIIHILGCYPLSWAITAIVFIVYYQFNKRKVLAMEF